MFDKTCKDGTPFTIEEKYVLGIAKPDEYTFHIIEAMKIAISTDGKHYIAFLTRLAKIHPELAHAVNCLIHGNLQEVYHQRQEKTKEIIREMGY